MSDPLDFTGQYNTPLTPEQEAAYIDWRNELSSKKGYDASQDERDYDLRGAWQSGAKQASNGHLPDTFKKPNHPTFSDQSQYSGPLSGMTGGSWQKSGDAWRFIASPDLLKFRTPEQMQDYFKTREPGNEVVFQNTAFKPKLGLGAQALPQPANNIFAPLIPGQF